MPNKPKSNSHRPKAKKKKEVNVVVSEKPKDDYTEFVEKWAEDGMQKGENFFLVKDLQHNGIDKSVWKGRFRVNWYKQYIPEGKTIMRSTMTRSLFLVVKESRDGLYAEVPELEKKK